jgi:hypothetical protein
MNRKLPVFLCKQADNGDTYFWCPFCRKYHWHSGLGHRAAHCHTEEGRAAFAGGYLLRPYPGKRSFKNSG